MTARAVDPAAVQIETQLLALSQQSITIVDQITYDEAVDYRVRLKARLDAAESVFEPMRAKAYEAYQEVLNQKKRVMEPGQHKLKNVDVAIASWTREQKRIEDDRRRQAEATQQRKLEQQRAKEVKQAVKLGADEESVASIASAPLVAAPVRVEPTYQKSAAIATVDNWKAEITSLKKFVKYIAKECDKNPGALSLLVGLKVLNQTAITTSYHSPGLNQMATAQKQLLTIPGVRAYNDSYVKSNAKR